MGLLDKELAENFYEALGMTRQELAEVTWESWANIGIL